MTLTEFRYIVAVARERHFGRAAEACFVSQPTLSVGVKKLEEQLGITLFERSKSDVRTTPQGEAVVEQAQRILEQVSLLKQLAKQNSDQLDGPLKIGAIFTIGPYLLPSLIPQLRELAPKMPLHIDEDYTHNLRTKLRHGELDAIIVALPFDEPEVEVVPLYQEDFIALLPEKHPWVKRDSLRIVDIADEVMIMLGAGHCFRDQVLEACPQCKDSSLNPQKDWITGSSIETIRQMVASGLGISVIPKSAADFHNEKLGLVTREFDEPKPSRQVALAYRRSFPRKQALDLIKQALNTIEVPGTPINS
ncbi:hydrogen peroxide-inducible genes activator [Kangiella sediminilitoris]|uniref:Transcriptional regulator, LysR family n=1 Tax=Kangiella sediminilitoris TaxID=1144748 RepID=A0A1B3B7Z6_9GAMM|nr:hydrogen peroxide-inducible genes activator [Kangiella sediminilitoris]AOE48912.1 Transcriptional regulator, LysR family [Kangiella sediminilitoris]